MNGFIQIVLQQGHLSWMFPELENLFSKIIFAASIIALNRDISFQDSHDNNKEYAAIFSPFWNEIIKSLREEDYISNR